MVSIVQYLNWYMAFCAIFVALMISINPSANIGLSMLFPGKGMRRSIGIAAFFTSVLAVCVPIALILGIWDLLIHAGTRKQN